MIEVKPTPEGKWSVVVDGHVLGESKARFDADHAVAIIKNHVDRRVAEAKRQECDFHEQMMQEHYRSHHSTGEMGQ